MKKTNWGKTMKPKLVKLLAAALSLVFLFGCASDAGELLDLALNPPDRKPIDRTILGVNNFFVDPEFGSISAQYSEIRDTLGIHFVRVLFAWTDGVQPSPNSDPSYGFYDSIIDSIPAGVDVLIVLAHTPNWMADASNWIDGNPRITWVERWVRPTVERYAGRPGIIGWEVWNEPDNTVVPSDAALGLTDPARYLELLNYGAEVIRTQDSSRLVVMAASRSIQQGGGDNFDYNIQLQSLGAEDIVDIWNVHYYGKQFEQVIRSGGIADFLNSLHVPIWITESGQQGVNEQLAYVETTWPFLQDQIPGIQRIYYYQFGEPGPADTNYGLRTTDPNFPVSDLYVYLRDN
jgi:hypothetical protein